MTTPFDNFDKDGLPRKNHGSSRPQPFQNPGYNSQPQYQQPPQQQQFQQPQYGQSPAPYNGYQPAQAQNNGYHNPSKSKAVALLLCFFLGAFGVHNFYLGQNNKGFLHLGLFLSTIVPGLQVVTAPVLSIWILVEFILIILDSGDYNTKGY